MKRALTRITYEIIERNQSIEGDRFSRDQNGGIYIALLELPNV